MLETKEQTIERMKELINELNNYRKSYYNDNISMISDYEYDKLFDELKEIENTLNIYYPNSPTQQVGYTVVSNLEKVKHEYPLLSLDKTKTINDIIKFAEGNDLCYSAKMDGLTICLTYENGYLVKAETRGDGFEGELVTHNVSTFCNVPLSISYKEHLVVVGEAILRKNQLNIINAELPEDKRYKHVRNLVSGTVRQLDSKICAKRNPMFIAWDCLTDIAPTLNDKLIKLNALGFAIVPCLIYSVNQPNIYNETTYNILSAGIDTIKDICNSFDYPIDGIVFTLDNINIGKLRGQTEHHFKNAIAYKFYDEEIITHLRDIEWSIGRTGVLTPVAIFDTVDIDGTDVSRASLHNVSILRNLKLGLGDEITVYKANQIIPQINDNFTKSNNYKIPEICPYCGSKTEPIMDNNSVILTCSNDKCRGRKLQEIIHFASKPCMNIVGLSEASIKLFLQNNWISNTLDIYNGTLKSHYVEIVNIDGWGKKSADNLMSSIIQSKNVKLENAINALGIDNIGIKASKDIAKFCEYNWHNFIDPMYYTKFCNIDGFGSIMYNSIITYITNNTSYIKELFGYFNFIDKVVEFNTVAPNLLNKTFVITGSLNYYKNRNELVSVIENGGGKVASSVSAKTDYLINNDINSNSSKNKKAKELNIPIITEEDFNKLICTTVIIGVDLAQNTDFTNEEIISVNSRKNKKSLF